MVCYAIIFFFFKDIVYKIGQEKFESNNQRFRAVDEVFGAFKEVKLSNLENYYLKRFSKPALLLANKIATAKLIQSLPRFALEIVAFGGLIMVILFLLKIYGDISNALPILGLYAFAGYRILPSLQLIYQSITSIKFLNCCKFPIFRFHKLKEKKENNL